MISHKHKCIFLHIPKAAGTSIETAFGHLDGHQGREGQDHRSLRMLLWPTFNPSAFSSRDNLKEVVKACAYPFQAHRNPNNMVVVTKEQYRSYFKFTVVRNPWARAYSWYQNVMRDEIHQRTLGVDRSISFRDFLARFRGRGILKPQTYWIQDFNNRIQMDHVCRFENLQSDFSDVCSKLGMAPISLPHTLKGSGRSYTEVFDDVSRKMIEETYGEEIRLFGYSYNILE